MCGIIGYIGENQAAPILLDGLSKLEYRGYDSSGIAVYNQISQDTTIVKAKGPLQKLIQKISSETNPAGNCGIGHTRWATHGEPSVENAHPHISNHHSVILVHNGIIENYQELKDELLKTGYHFSSQTDSEVVVNMIDYYYKKFHNPLDAISETLSHLHGSYAFAIMFADFPDKLFAVRNQSPLILCENTSGCLIASDSSAILPNTQNVFYMDDGEIAEITKSDIYFFDFDKNPIKKDSEHFLFDSRSTSKNGFEHFMLKEICEQPQAIRDTFYSYYSNGEIDLKETGLSDHFLASLKHIYIVGCGSAYHTGLSAKYVLEQLTNLTVEVDIASEFRYRNPILAPDSLVIIISQSGETADSLAALRLAKKRKVPVLGIVNVAGSSIARESDYTMYTFAGTEISVATTKAYSTQLIVLYLLAIKIAVLKCTLEKALAGMLLLEIELIPDKISQILAKKEHLQNLASQFTNVQNMFYIGRGIDYAISLEGSLKMKEISYIHSEAYPAGELKHGTISLIEPAIPVIGVMTQPDLYEKTMSNLMEVKTRGAVVYCITSSCNANLLANVDCVITFPQTHSLFTTSLAIVPLQLLSYYACTAKGLDVDKPRNLAKSVTVE